MDKQFGGREMNVSRKSMIESTLQRNTCKKKKEVFTDCKTRWVNYALC